jgi:tRNA 2-(methylsulfanyl)-N6-isopentenyladenosine37 hydroxylase
MTMQLHCESSAEWLGAVMNQFDHFLMDHAANEKKASSSALTLAAHYPDKPDFVAAMIDLAIEELNHYREVFRILCDRDLMIGPDEKDAYVKQFRTVLRPDSVNYFLDRLLTAGSLKSFYQSIAHSESRHADLFLDFAVQYSSSQTVNDRLTELLPFEAKILESLPIRPVLH